MFSSVTVGRSGGDGHRKFSAENFRGESENMFAGVPRGVIPVQKVVPIRGLEA